MIFVQKDNKLSEFNKWVDNIVEYFSWTSKNRLNKMRSNFLRMFLGQLLMSLYETSNEIFLINLE